MDEPLRRHRLRTTFEEVAELYDRARPGYPEEVFDELVSLGSLRDGARILEIGPGTGKATLELARRGFELVAVELGAALANVARAKLAPFPNVEIVTAQFETWEPSGGPFDAVVSFTAFHWIDPDVRYEKSARLLREPGTLAVVSTKHVLPHPRDRFWIDVQEDYAAVTPEMLTDPPPHPDDVPDSGGEIEESGRFRNVAVRRHTWTARYTVDEYIAVLDTYSGHRALEDERRERLYDRIRRRILAEPELAVTKTYLTTLNVAERVRL
jgi:SAM-dependent methyltransferase